MKKLVLWIAAGILLSSFSVLAQEKSEPTIKSSTPPTTQSAKNRGLSTSKTNWSKIKDIFM